MNNCLFWNVANCSLNSIPTSLTYYELSSIGTFIFLSTLLDTIGPSDPTYLFDKVSEKCLNGRQGNTETKSKKNDIDDSSDLNDLDVSATMESTNRTSKLSTKD
jgi:hypothetical protein